MTFKKALTIYLLAILLAVTTTLLIRFIEYGTAIDTIIEIGLNGETIPETDLTKVFFSFSTLHYLCFANIYFLSHNKLQKKRNGSTIKKRVNPSFFTQQLHTVPQPR